MKTRFLFYCTCIATCLLTACSNQTPPVTFSTVSIKRSNASDTVVSYNIDISYLNAVSASEALRVNLADTTDKWLRNIFDSKGNEPIETIVDTWIAQLEKDTIRIDEDDAIIINRFEFTCYPDSVYQNEEVLSIRYNAYWYSGGAHGMESVTCFNFDKATGKMIHYTELVKDNKRLLEVAELLFRKQQDIPNNQPLDEQYFFENGIFVLSNSFSFSKNTLHFYYQPYEVAPYSAGVIDLRLPNSEVKGLVNYIK